MGDVQATILRRFAPDLDLLDRMIALAVATIDKASDREVADQEPLAIALSFRALARGVGSARAARLLFCNGFEAETAAPARTLFELALDIVYLLGIGDRAEQDAEAKAFTDWEASRMGLHVENLVRTGATVAEMFSVAARATGMAPDEIHADIQARRAKAIEENQYRGERDWSKHDRRRRAQLCKPSFLEQYDVAYRSLCDMTHSSGSALMGAFEKTATGEGYAPEPRSPLAPMFISITARMLGLLTIVSMHAVGENPALALAVLDEQRALELSQLRST